MKVYMHTDIEGVAGFCFFENHKDTSYWNGEHRKRMQRILTGEVNAAARAAFDSGATEVVINDAHSSGYNILFEELDPRCEIIHGRVFSGPHWLPDLDDTYDAMLLVGQHAMTGTKGALLAHSHWLINDQIHMSEASMAAALAGHHGVPTVFVSGDDKLTAELQEKIPHIEVAVVKKGLGAYQARSLVPSRACELIYEGVRRGLENRADIAPYVVPGPIRANLIELDPDGNWSRCTAEDVEAPDIDQAFLQYEAKMPWTKFPVLLPDGFEYP